MNFKRYVEASDTWVDSHYIMGTSTDTIATLPADIYANDTTATVGLKGQMEQSGTPTPTNPIQPQECGDLETTGEHTGQYKIPILSNSTTTPVYLGEVQTTRKIKKLVLTGEESWVNTGGNAPYRLIINDIAISPSTTSIEWYCSHYQSVSNEDSWASYDYCISRMSTTAQSLQFRDITKGDITAFKQYLATQYAAGTPVTVWYVLANETTGIVNEPLRKIDTYADEVSGITIPTIAGANTISIGTTLQPSEVTVNYHGWHPVQSVHERESGAWT